MENSFYKRGFLPADDPLACFSPGSPYECLDQLGADLPSLLMDSDCRKYLRNFAIPSWSGGQNELDDLPGQLAACRLYYLRMGFVCSAYVNQIGQPAVHEVPANLAQPFCKVCELLERPPILSYDGYALYNWRRFDSSKPVVLGNIDTLQNFVHLYDEHWFILVHVAIEQLAAEILAAIFSVFDSVAKGPLAAAVVNQALINFSHALGQINAVLRRIPEHMSADLYFKKFRPYIRFFEDVSYAGVTSSWGKRPLLNRRGETGAQSSVMPALEALLKIPHQASTLVNHLLDMRDYMPVAHKLLIEQIEQLPAIKALADEVLFDDILEKIAEFREVHFHWARQYIHEKVTDPLGTGGTPYMQWLLQLIDETRGFKFHPGGNMGDSISSSH